jgi:hypothetical protein
MVKLDILKESADHNNMKKKAKIVAQQLEKKQLFIASCFSTCNSSSDS